jgi:ATP-dependent exoDNAse (exonuclease V) beta subunit
MLDAAAPVESAWISTIHGLCARVLRAHALEAESIPSFAVASDTEMRILQSDAFASAVEAFAEGDVSTRLDLLARYGRDRHAPDGDRAARRLRRRGPAARAAAPPRAHPGRSAEAARGAAQRSADLALIEQLLAAVRPPLPGRQGSARAPRLRRPRAGRPRPAAARPEVAGGYRERFAEVMVDEFQDTNRLQVELVELVCGGDLFLVGDEFQSIYRFRRADVDVYREQRQVAGAAVIALDRNYRRGRTCSTWSTRPTAASSTAGYRDLVAAGELRRRLAGARSSSCS